MKIASHVGLFGLVIASAFTGAPSVALAQAYGPETCNPGYVWREASPADFVCVSPQARTRTARENAQAINRRDPTGAYGSATCIQGYVWREAFLGDVVCVTPNVRTLVQYENSMAAANRVRG